MRELQAARGAALSQPGESDPAQEAGEPAVGRTHPRRRLVLALVAAVVLALDITTKVLVVAELEGRRVLELLGGQLLFRDLKKIRKDIKK